MKQEFILFSPWLLKSPIKWGDTRDTEPQKPEP